MSGIYSGIEKMLEFMLTPIKFIGTFITWTNMMLNWIGNTITELLNLIANIPNWISAYMVVALVIIVIYQLLGRGTGR